MKTLKVVPYINIEKSRKLTMVAASEKLNIPVFFQVDSEDKSLLVVLLSMLLKKRGIRLIQLVGRKLLNDMVYVLSGLGIIFLVEEKRK